MIELLSIFTKKKTKKKSPNLKFGRFTDSYKEEEKYQFWDYALKCFEDQQYLDCFEYFLKYLSNDKQQNLSYTRDSDHINFSLFQGSKLMTGIASNLEITAEVKIAVVNGFNIGFLRKLISMNYKLKYSRYAIDEQGDITMVFNSSMLDSSPYKLYYGLKELGVSADKQDDILIGEFDELTSINTGHIRDISEKEKNSRYLLLQSELKQVFEVLENSSLDINAYPGGLSYFLLSVVYKLDYLTTPEGSTMHQFEKIHKNFFASDGMTPQEKNRNIVKALKLVSTYSQEDFFKELYKVKSTFGLVAPSSHENLVESIVGELTNMNWYLANGHKVFAQAIPLYIIGNSLYSFALPAPDKALLEIIYQISNPKYFNSLGYEDVFFERGKLSKKNILSELKTIVENYEDEYKDLKLNTKMLNFKNPILFSKSLLMMISKIKMTKSINPVL